MSTRRLAAILAADVVGYSAMVGADEPGTLARVRALRTDVIGPLVAAHEGRLFKTTGPGKTNDAPSDFVRQLIRVKKGLQLPVNRSRKSEASTGILGCERHNAGLLPGRD
jgi:adenylate cyclase